MKIVRTWDQLPPVVYEDPNERCEAISTRVLEKQHQDMRDALEAILNREIDACTCRSIAGKALYDVAESQIHRYEEDENT